MRNKIVQGFKEMRRDAVRSISEFFEVFLNFLHNFLVGAS